MLKQKTTYRYLLWMMLLCGVLKIHGQEPLLQNAYSRKSFSLNGPWKYIVDPYENGFYNYRYQPFENQKNPGNGAFFTNAKRKDKADLVEYDFDKMDDLNVPGDWNSQNERLFYYEGSLWYKKSFDYKKEFANGKVFLYFGGANYQSDVYLNGEKLGRHIGGFTPFQYEVSALLKAKDNFLIVKVDNKRKKEGVPTLNTDWWNYGGITRDVKLIETPPTYIQDYRLSVTPEEDDVIEGQIQLEGLEKNAQKITLSIPELNLNETLVSDEKGKVSFRFPAKELVLWSPSSPKLYTVNIETPYDKINDRIGFRTIETQGDKILLNGEKIFLKGISIHEESPIKGGRATSPADAEKLLSWAKALGCNYVRLAHYPHNEHMLRMADEMGILVWEEIPVYWTIDWENQATFENAKNQLNTIIQRDKNRASVVIWSMANETPNSSARESFLGRLAEFAKAQDPSRLISAALEQKQLPDDPFTRTISDPFAKVVDVLSFNQYIGWYDGGIEKCKKIKWEITQNKPVIISEFGAGAKYGLHGDKDERWTEEYQAYLYEETLKMLDQIKQLSGISPWILVDFKSPRRVLPEIQDNFNRKGLISEKGEKKMAFYVLQEYYKQK